MRLLALFFVLTLYSSALFAVPTSQILNLVKSLISQPNTSKDEDSNGQNMINIISDHLGKSTEEAAKIVNEHMRNVDNDPGSLISKDSLIKLMQSNSVKPQMAGSRSIMLQSGQGFNGLTNFQPSSWTITETMSGPTEKSKNEATGERQQVYKYPLGLGPVLMNQCTESNYTESSPCYNSKLFNLQSLICHKLFDAAVYIGVGFDGRGYYRADSRKASLVQRMCSNKMTFMGFDVPDTMNVFGIFETSAETHSFLSASEYMRYIRHKAGVSNQKNVLKSESNKYSSASSGGFDFGGFGSILGAVAGGPMAAALGGTIGNLMGGGGGSGSGNQQSIEQSTSKSTFEQTESSHSSQGSSQHYFAIMFVNVIMYEITLDDVKPTDLTLAVLKDYMALPDSYYSVGADVKYQNFLMRWGTHYIRAGKFGGQLKITKTLQINKAMTEYQFASLAETEFKSMFATMQSEYTQKSGGFSFFGLGSTWKSTDVKSKAEVQQSTESTMNSNYKMLKNAHASEFTRTTVEAQGGTPEIAEALVDFYTPAFKQLYHEWLVSIKDYVKLFDFQLKSINELFNMNMDDLFPSGNHNFGCGSGAKTKIVVENKTKRRYYIDTYTEYIGNKTVDVKVRVYCKYSSLEQFKTDINRRRLALERAVGVYMIEGPFPTSSFELPAGELGCEETTLSTLKTTSKPSDKMTFIEMKKNPFLLTFDMPAEIPGLFTEQAKCRVIYRSGMWFATDPKSAIMHMYDGCQLSGIDLRKQKMCIRNIILTYNEEVGFFYVEPLDYTISKIRIPQLPYWLSGSYIARPKRLELLTELNGVQVTKNAVPCNVKWLNSHRLDPGRDENCIHFTAATEGDIFIVFASIPKDHHTWYYLQVSPNGASFYQGLKLQKSDSEEGMGTLGDKNLFQSFFVCVAQLRSDPVIMQYGKADPDSEVGMVYSAYTFPPKSQFSRLSFYSFGSGSTAVSLMDVRLTTMIPEVTCLNNKYKKINGYCVLICHNQCIGCINANDSKACHQCKNVRVEWGEGTGRVVDCLPQCPAGYELSAKYEKLCVPCLVGQFKNHTGNDRCSKCQAGTYIKSTGATECTPCSPGKFNDEKGKASCEECPAGMYVALEKAKKCNTCPMGHFSSRIGSISCNPCPYGHYVNQTGMATCFPCPSGTYAAHRGQISCIRCPVGTNSKNNGSRSCSNSCLMGEFSPKSGVACQKCPPGTHSESAGSSTCFACARGSFQPSSGQGACIPAPAGSYATGLGAINYTLCPYGHYSRRGFDHCLLCDGNTFGTKMGAASCDICPFPLVSSRAGTRCQPKESCPEGQFWVDRPHSRAPKNSGWACVSEWIG